MIITTMDEAESIAISNDCVRNEDIEEMTSNITNKLIDVNSSVLKMDDRFNSAMEKLTYIEKDTLDALISINMDLIELSSTQRYRNMILAFIAGINTAGIIVLITILERLIQ